MFRSSRIGALLLAVGLLAAGGVERAAALEAELFFVDGKRVLFLSGPVRVGDQDKIIPRIAKRDFDEIWIHSNGGDVEAAYEIGYAIRERGLATRVAASHVCASACVDMFLGGVIRHVEPGALMVIHPGSISNSSVILNGLRAIDDEEDARMTIRSIERRTTHETANWAQYLNFMGVSVELVNRAAEVDFSEGICLTEDELIYYNIVNTRGAPAPGYRPGPPIVNCWR